MWDVKQAKDIRAGLPACHGDVRWAIAVPLIVGGALHLTPAQIIERYTGHQPALITTLCCVTEQIS
ncbi:hypothetical protein ACFQY3_06135 [Paenibacillus farraposensis]|uniref:hypothetical protein n=1 Tax=Paenibacillus farraposensis TaxID=2807095 RepID=UPI001E341B2B|nr:hypothetical protein [Paenibacillus farraposensis]